MPYNFFAHIRELAASIDAPVYEPEHFEVLEFPIHPSASELAESMLVDPEALKNETYEPGIYDEDGDYYPQYSDDPSKLPDYIEPNVLDAPVQGETAPESLPASESKQTGDPTESKSE